jgi:deoxyribonuclease V
MARRSKLHSWNLSTVQARDLQLELAGRVDSKRPLPPYATVAGADVSYDLRGKWLHAAVVVLRAGSFEVIDRAGIVTEAKFPYVPGLLSFREAPAVIAAFGRLKTRPDIMICDGQGIAHPRRMGLAAHLGLCLEIPTIGCAKTWLCGEYQEPGPARGDWTPLMDGVETIGAVVRTRSMVKPLFVSPGHRCDLASAIAAIVAASPTYRLPVPSRLAHQYVNDLRRQRAAQ